MTSKENDNDWWDLLPPPEEIAVKPKPSGKRNDDWNNIPPYVESMIFAKCSEGNWIDCRICKKILSYKTCHVRSNIELYFSI